MEDFNGKILLRVGKLKTPQKVMGEEEYIDINTCSKLILYFYDELYQKYE